MEKRVVEENREMSEFHLLIGIHNHQPVGNFPRIFEETYEKAYAPFLDLLLEFPSVKVTMHYSGILLQWLVHERKEYIEKLRSLVKSGRVELLTGGYYEPILPSIPDADKLGQIRKLTNYIEEQFEHKPKGLWLAERVWEPHLPRILNEAGVEYTILDESHFRMVGLQEEELFGYYVTEEEGSPLVLFPISERLRHAIPFSTVPEVSRLLLKWAEEFQASGTAIFADDGEKFGSWPTTYEEVYRKGWLKGFFAFLEEQKEKIATMTYSECRQGKPPLGRIYIPACSYSEMMEWCLPSSSQKVYQDVVRDEGIKKALPFVRGGFWRNFHVKYPESNNIHKKALYVSKKVEKLKDPELKAQAQDDLWKGQCNCGYWHGVFGGLYLPHLRQALYHYLIRAENLVDRFFHRGGKWITMEVSDLNKDLREEILVSTESLSLYLDPSLGGSLFELDYKPKMVNYLDTMTRREEAYHRKLLQSASREVVHAASGGRAVSIHEELKAKEEGLEAYLTYDWYRRTAFLDHFLQEATTPENFRSARYGEQGDFVQAPYQYALEHRAGEILVTFSRDGHVWVGGEFLPIKVEKAFSICSGKPTVDVWYTITNASPRPLPVWFGVEVNLAFLAGAHEGSGVMIEGEGGEKKSTLLPFAAPAQHEALQGIHLADGVRKVLLSFVWDRPCGSWHFPVETVSQSESGFERIFQGVATLFHWKISLPSRGFWRGRCSMTLNELNSSP